MGSIWIVSNVLDHQFVLAIIVWIKLYVESESKQTKKQKKIHFIVRKNVPNTEYVQTDKST